MKAVMSDKAKRILSSPSGRLEFARAANSANSASSSGTRSFTHEGRTYKVVILGKKNAL